MSGLEVDYETLSRKVGQVFGFGNIPSEYEEEQKQLVYDTIREGLLSFYYPQATGVFHQWSFLQPEFEFKTTSAQADYELPDDFSGSAGDLHFDSTDNTHEPLKIVGEGKILALRSTNTSISGFPTHGAVRPKNTQGEKPQGWELMLWPTPDATYTLRGSYRAVPPMLSEDRPHPYGGTPHAGTVMNACLARAEEIATPNQGTFREAFVKSLSASIEHDRSGTRPEHFGYCGNGPMRYRRPRWSTVRATYAGSDYSGP